MYTIPLKDNNKEIDLVVMRSLLALAGITAFFYRTTPHALINIIIAVVLFLLAAAVKYLVSEARVKKIVLLLFAGALLFAATKAITFSVLLVVFGMLSSLVYKKPFVMLSQDGVTVKSSTGNNEYGWDEFNNIVIKDNLLTLDYKSNKLLQLEVDTSANSVNEMAVNDFCNTYLEL